MLGWFLTFAGSTFLAFRPAQANLDLARSAESISLSIDNEHDHSSEYTSLVHDRHRHVLLSEASKRANAVQADPYERSWPNTIAICAMMKNERKEDVKEFIDYHRWIGVDTFYLAENGDECAIKDELAPYINAGVLELQTIPGPKHPAQTNWYNDCSKKASKLHSWVAFVDLDEFIMVLAKSKAETGRNSLKRVLHNSFRYTAAVSMQWVLFGSAGHIDMPLTGQLKGFNKCTGLLSKQMKCLGNSYWLHPHKTFEPEQVHQCNFRFPPSVAVLGNSVPMRMFKVNLNLSSKKEDPVAASYAPHLSPNDQKQFSVVSNDYQIVLFHFVTRSRNWFLEVKSQRIAGKYGSGFAEIMRNSSTTDPAELFRKFERSYGFDGSDSICAQGGRVSDAMQEARDDGWNPVPTKLGILAQ